MGVADSEVFDFVCTQLEQLTSLDRLEARGTVRLAVKEAGFDARTVSPGDMAVIVQKLLPRELTARGVEDGEGTCARIASEVGAMTVAPTTDTPDAVFQRLGGEA